MRRDLEKDVVGRRVKTTEVRPTKNAMRAIRRHGKRKDFTSRLDGRKVTKAERKGKYILLHLDSGEVLVVHFGMSGQFLRANKRTALRHDRMSDTLSSQEVRRLYRAIQEVVQEAIRYRGTTLEDEAYLDLFGKPGEYQHELKVYGRRGLPCRRCRTAIETVRISNR